jgi:Virulence factor membrane-bound polymerase, C-terminal/O-Antigen ligase/Protein glycosylation ligase
MLSQRLFYSGLAIFAFAWLGYDHYRPWVNFHSEALSLAGFTLLIAAILSCRLVIQAPKNAAIACTALAVFICLQYTLGLVPFGGDALVSSIFIAGLFVATTVGFTISQDEGIYADWLLAYMHAIWMAAFTSAFVGLMQWFSVEASWGMYVVQSDIGSRAMGNLGQANQLATLLLMGLAALAYVQRKRPIHALALGAVVVVITMALVLAQSRAALLSAILIMGFACWKRRVPSKNLATGWIAVWFAGFLLATALLPTIAQVLLIDGPRSMIVNGSEVRLVMWKQMVHALLESPWVGYGWNYTPAAQRVGALAYPVEFTFNYAHNIVLDILVWCGIPVGLLIIGVTTYWVLHRAIKMTDERALYAMAGLIPILVHSLVEYPFAYAYFLLAAGLLIGVIERYAVTSKSINLHKIPMGIAIALWVSLAGYLVYEYLLIEEDFRVVRLESQRIGITPSEYAVPKIVLLTQLGTMLDAGRLYPKPDMTALDIEKLRQVSKRFSYGTLNNRYVTALALNGQIDEAKKELLVVKAMYGTDYYNAFMQVLREQRQTKYPVLAKLVD